VLIYLAQRIGLALLICILAMTILFSLVYVIPGDPASIALGPRATPEMREALRLRMGLDQPLALQLLRFFRNAVTGDLGLDLFSRRPVAAIVLENLPYTLALIGAGLGSAVAIGIPLGCYSALHRNSIIDRLTGIVSVGAISIPSFVVGIYAIVLFAVVLNWFPAIGVGETGNPVDQLWHLVLPAFAVGLGWVGYLARIVRASMLEVMAENHIRTARAFGLTEPRIIVHYALRIAILPTVTLLGLATGYLLSSAVFAETVFARPGIGKLVVDMVQTRNYPVVQGAVLVTVTLFVLAQLTADLIVAWLDPRVRASI
jgi:peptide/nickel transport system permease protein